MKSESDAVGARNQSKASGNKESDASGIRVRLPNIKTEHVYPPIPIRQFDWCAYDDETYDGPGSLIGHGRTEAEAVADFKEQWEEKYGTEASMNSPEVRAGFYEVIDLNTDEQHGSYATLDEARGAVRYDRLKAYAIWRDNVRVECCEEYDGDDDRVKQGLGQANASEQEAPDWLRWPNGLQNY